MQVLNSTKLIFVDIDDTLVIWAGSDYTPHPLHIESIKKFYKRGHTLIAWSAGGATWAARVVRELNLEQYFWAAIGKPDWFLDDKTSSEFMPELNRVYFPLTEYTEDTIVKSRRDWSQVSKFVTSKEEG